jgi:hypothetical protein
MIAVAAVACLLSMPYDKAITVVAFSALGLALWTARSLLLRGCRRRAAACFWVMGTLANVLYAACCICPFHIVRVFLFVVWMLFVFPILTGFGIAWAKLATRESAIPLRAPNVVWPAVIVLAVMPVSTLWTLWPLRSLFFVGRPYMESLADQAAAGKGLTGPRWVGPLGLLGSSFNVLTDEVHLTVISRRDWRCGFVRLGPHVSPQQAMAVRAAGEHLGGSWWYWYDEE